MLDTMRERPAWRPSRNSQLPCCLQKHLLPLPPVLPEVGFQLLLRLHSCFVFLLCLKAAVPRRFNVRELSAEHELGGQTTAIYKK